MEHSVIFFLFLFFFNENVYCTFLISESAVGVTPDYYNDVTTIIGPTGQ